MGRLDNKVAVVTGGGRGIGRGITEVLISEGAAVVIADIDLESARATEKELRAAGAEITVVEMDVTSADSIESATKEAIAWKGAVDILVNNAGVVGEHVGLEVTEQDWDVCFEVNVKGIWAVSNALIPHFRDQGGGKIVNIASIAGRQGGAGLSHYSASKAGAISLTQSQAATFGPNNINVNAVCPGLLWTNMWRSLEAMMGRDDTPEKVDRRAIFDSFIERNCPLRREQFPEDIGQAVAFLVSDAARNITGQALNVDGGIEMN